MRRYVNTKTGAVIEVKSEVSGGYWREVTPAAPAQEEKKNDEVAPVQPKKGKKK